MNQYHTPWTINCEQIWSIPYTLNYKQQNKNKVTHTHSKWKIKRIYFFLKMKLHAPMNHSQSHSHIHTHHSKHPDRTFTYPHTPINIGYWHQESSKIHQTFEKKKQHVCLGKWKCKNWLKECYRNSTKTPHKNRSSPTGALQQARYSGCNNIQKQDGRRNGIYSVIKILNPHNY